MYIVGGKSIWQRIGKGLVKDFADTIPPLSETLWENWKQNVKAPDWLDK